MVDLLPTDEQKNIADTVRRFLAEEFPVERLISKDVDPARLRLGWDSIAELGCLAIGLSEAQGGAGLTLVEEMLVAQEFGRILGPPEIFGAILAARLAAACGSESMARGIGAGAARVAALAPVTPFELKDGLTGDFYLFDHDQADFALLVSPVGAMLFPMDAITVEEAIGLDAFVPIARVNAINLKPVWAKYEPAWWHQALLLAAAYLSGLIQAACAMATGYAKLRQQFGQPIGAFQAVKHRCVDMAIGAEAIGSQIAFAALAIRNGAPDAAFQAMSAKLVAGQNAVRTAQDNIQVHGAIGVTSELAPHLYLKRAHLIDRLFGSNRLLGGMMLSASVAYSGNARLNTLDAMESSDR